MTARTNNIIDDALRLSDSELGQLLLAIALHRGGVDALLMLYDQAQGQVDLED